MNKNLKARINQFAGLVQSCQSSEDQAELMADKFCGLQCLCSGKKPDHKGYKGWKAYLEKNASFLQKENRQMLPMVSWQMSMEPEPELFLKKLEDCCSLLEGGGFIPCSYLIIAAMYLARAKKQNELEEACRRTRMLYQAMKKAHPFATDKEEYSVAAMLAASGIKVPELQQRFSRIEELLQKWIFRGGQLPAISNVILLFHVDDIALCERAINLSRVFLEKGYEFSSRSMAALLGLLSISKETAPKLSDQIIAAADYLKEQDGFGASCMNQKQWTALACSLYLSEGLEDGEEVMLSSVTVQSMTADYGTVLQTMFLSGILSLSESS